MRGATARTLLPALAALLGLLVVAGSSGAAGRIGVGKMTVTPNRVSAGSAGNDLTFTFTADSAALTGQTIVDVPVSWSPPQRTSPAASGYVEVQPTDCLGSTRITAIVRRRITIATACGRRHVYRLIYHHATAPRLAADGYVFLTQTRAAAGTGKKVVFRPLGPRKQPVVRVRGASASGLFISTTSVATSGTPFNVTVRAIDPFGNNAADYAGTVTMTSTDTAASLPAPYAYGPADLSQHTFTGVILRTPGTQRITATDSNGFSITSGPIAVSLVSSG
ncbi:MAG TPA: hypothetical protein VGJ27_05710 [Gaiellaceae bacterium]